MFKFHIKKAQKCRIFVPFHLCWCVKSGAPRDVSKWCLFWFHYDDDDGNDGRAKAGSVIVVGGAVYQHRDARRAVGKVGCL